MSGTAWESVYSTPADIMERRAVAGGWLYRNRVAVSASGQNVQDWVWAISLAFVSEPAPLGNAGAGQAGYTA